MDGCAERVCRSVLAPSAPRETQEAPWPLTCPLGAALCSRVRSSLVPAVYGGDAGAKGSARAGTGQVCGTAAMWRWDGDAGRVQCGG